MKFDNRGRNPEFVISGIQMIFRRNYGVSLDSHLIDTKLTFSENFNYLYDKFVCYNISKDEYE